MTEHIRKSFERWSKEQGWEIEGYPDARQRWLVWQAAYAARDEEVERWKSAYDKAFDQAIANGSEAASARDGWRDIGQQVILEARQELLDIKLNPNDALTPIGEATLEFVRLLLERTERLQTAFLPVPPKREGMCS